VSELSTYILANYPTGWTAVDVVVFFVDSGFAWDPDMVIGDTAAQTAHLVAQAAVTGRTNTSGVADAADVSSVTVIAAGTADRLVLFRAVGADDEAIAVIDITPSAIGADDVVSLAWSNGANKVFNIAGGFGTPTVTVTAMPSDPGGRECDDAATFGFLQAGIPTALDAYADATFHAATGDVDAAYGTGLSFWVESPDTVSSGTPYVSSAYATLTPAGSIGPSHAHVTANIAATKFGTPSATEDTGFTYTLIPIVWTKTGFTVNMHTVGFVGYHPDTGPEEGEALFSTSVPIPGGTYDELGVWLVVTIRLEDDTVSDGYGWAVQELDMYLCGDDVAGTSVQLYLLDGDTPAWVDLGANDLGLLGPYTCSRTCSLQGPYIRPSAGRLSFTLDNGATGETDAGQWSPENPTSPWRDPDTDVTLLRQGLPARVVLTPPGGSATQIWGGRVTDWPPNYLSDLYSTVDVVCVDAVDRLQAANLAALQQAVGAGETAAQRIQRILDRIGYEPTSVLDATAWNTMQATTLERAAWDEILLTADSDGGTVFVDAFGQVHYLPRDFHVGVEPSLTLSLLGPDDDGYDADDYAFSDPQTTNDTRQQFNVIKLAPVGGIEQAAIADDAVPNDFYGYRTFDRSDLICQTNRQTMDLALWTIGVTRLAEFRFSRIQIDLFPQTPLAVWEAVLAADIAAKVQVKEKTPDGRSLICDQLLTGITWTINDRESVFRCVFDLAQAPPAYSDIAIDGDGNIALGQTTGWF
jgi:hypothetical protein